MSDDAQGPTASADGASSEGDLGAEGATATGEPGSDRGPATDGRAEASGRSSGSGRALRFITIGFGVAAVLMAVVAVVLWTSSGDGDEEPPPPEQIIGRVTVIDEGYAAVSGSSCRAEVGDGELTGTTVFLADGEGNQLGQATLGEGTKTAFFECSFDATFSDVPAAAAYQISVPGLASSDVVPRAALDEQGGVIGITQGTLGT